MASFGLKAGIDLLHVNLMQGHSLSGAQLVSATSERHYIKGDFLDEKRTAMQKWERWFLREIVGQPVSAKVVVPITHK